MRSCLKMCLALAAGLAIAVFGGTVVAQSADPGLPDTVYVDSVVAFTGSGAVVPLSFTNDELLGGIEVTLTYTSPDIHIDSFSFVGGRVETFTTTGWMTAGNTITIYCIAFDELILQGNGLLGNLYFGYLSSIDPQLVTIDTISVISSDVEYSTTFSDASSMVFAPQYVKGYFDILESGCCIGDRGNVDNSPDDAVDISDLIYLVDFMFQMGPAPECPEEANINGDAEGLIDISDLVYLVNYMFRDGSPPPPCN